MRKEARDFLSSLRLRGLLIEPIFLKKSYGSKWKQQAESKIFSSEIVIEYDTEACSDSINTKWELDRAKELGKPLVSLSRDDIRRGNLGALKSAYEFTSEFDECFIGKSGEIDQLLDLYKIMVASSEDLIKRRQITNGFFITIIGAIFGVTGLIVKEELFTSRLVLVLPILFGLLMCRSWKNLIENYGKLNKGKFAVINKLESQFDAQIFSAEWVALGKGVRKEKYQSFTNTEQNVPKYFSAMLIVVLVFTLLASDWTPVTTVVKDIWAIGSDAVDVTYQNFILQVGDASETLSTEE